MTATVDGSVEDRAGAASTAPPRTFIAGFAQGGAKTWISSLNPAVAAAMCTAAGAGAVRAGWACAASGATAMAKEFMSRMASEVIANQVPTSNRGNHGIFLWNAMG